MNSTVEVSLTRKLRELVGLQEVVLSPEEAELYDLQGTDLLDPDLLIIESGDYDYD